MPPSTDASHTNLPGSRGAGSATRLAWVVLGSFVLATVLAPLAKILTEATIEAGEDRYDFGRVYRRTLLIVSVVMLLLWWRQMGVGRRIAASFAPSPARWRQLFVGVGIALAAVGAFLLVGFLEGSLVASRRTLTSGVIVRVLYLATIVSLSEELLFNCIALDIMRERMPAWLAVILRSLLFSALHLLRARLYVEVIAGEHSIGRGFDPAVGLEVLRGAAASMFTAHWAAVLAEQASLFVLSVASSVAYLRTRRIYLSLGLHWGLVLALRLDGYALQSSRDVSWWFHSNHADFASPAGLVVQAFLLVAVVWASRSTTAAGGDAAVT